VIDRIQAMRTFIRIVDTNSFTRAAQSLDMPRATATTLVQNLEALLGTALLVRTTRRLSLTAEGAAYYERCAQILADEIHRAIADADRKIDVRETLMKIVERRQHQRGRHRARHFDAQTAAQLIG
jgi:DNA-binding transcriptional LysR family regulator